MRDLRHAWRSILKMPVALGGRRRVARHRHRREHGGLLVGSGRRPAAAARACRTSAAFTSSNLAPRPGPTRACRGWSTGDLRERLRSFPELLAFRMAPFTLGEPGRSERVFGLLVSGNYFSGARHAAGARPLPASGRGDASRRPNRSSVISHDFWQTRFSGAPDVLGQTLRVNDRQLTIVGVAPERFQGTVLGLNFDLWVPATLAPALQGGSRELEDRTMRGYQVHGTPAVAHSARAGAGGARSGDAGAGARVSGNQRDAARPKCCRSGRRRAVRSGCSRAMLAILQGIMLVLLLAVCGNTANLDARARQHAAARDRRPARARRRADGASSACCSRRTSCWALIGAALGAAIAVVGDRGDARGAAHRRVPDQVSDRASMPSASPSPWSSASAAA